MLLVAMFGWSYIIYNVVYWFIIMYWSKYLSLITIETNTNNDIQEPI